MPPPSSRNQEPPAGERLLVCLDPSPFSIPLIRATKRIADAQQAKWFALYVETPSHDRLSPENQEQVAQALYLAAKLGAQAVKVSGFRIGDEILAFARENRVSKIFVGKPYDRRWRRFLGISLVDHLIWNCGPIDIFVISGEGEGGSAHGGSGAQAAAAASGNTCWPPAGWDSAPGWALFCSPTWPSPTWR